MITLSIGFLVLLSACSTTAGPGGSSSSSASTPSSSSLSSSEARSHYEDAGIGYSIDVPTDWKIEHDTNLVTTDYEAKGTAYVASVTEGTTLNEAYFHVTQIASCPTLSDPQGTQTSITIGGALFQRSTWSEGAAGNLYEGITYAGPKDAGCLVLTGYLHSCNLGIDCGENHSAPFDKASYVSMFDAMAKSVQFLADPAD